MSNIADKNFYKKMKAFLIEKLLYQCFTRIISLTDNLKF
jgi:hypothetical protein